MAIKDHNLPMLNSRNDWTDWMNSIEDIAVRNDVWRYCDPEGFENLVFTATRPLDSANRDTVQRYQALQTIYNGEKKKYDKVSERIDITVCQEFKQHYLGIHDVRGKLIALADSIQPTAKDQKQTVRAEFEKLKKGHGNTGLEKWLSRWPALVNNAKRYKIENLSESQICDAFIEAAREINPPFYNYMKSKEAQVESDSVLINTTARALETISRAIITALDEINPPHASIEPVTMNTPESDHPEETDDDADIPHLQRATNRINKALRSFKGTNHTLSDNRITIGFCIKQFRSMAPPSERITRGRAAHATLQGRKHTHDSELSDEGQQSKEKRQRVDSTPTIANSPTATATTILRQDCVCGMKHKYSDCRYLNPTIAPDDWTPIVQIRSKIITSVKGSRRLRNKIEKNFQRLNIDLPDFWPSENEKTQHTKQIQESTASNKSNTIKVRAAHATSRLAFSTAVNDGYDDCFRLDNCADTHVCNDLTRFTEYTPLYDETIQFGDTGTQINGTGSVQIQVNTPSGPSMIKLENVAYVPGFHWNLINTHSLESQGLFFNTRTCWMEYEDGSNAFQATKHGAFRVIESNIEDAVTKNESYTNAAKAFATIRRSRTPKTAVASMDTWHARLGHIRKEALEHMPQAVEGAALSTRNFLRTSDLCPECQLGQAHQRPSKLPTWKGSYPFEKIHLDLIHMEEAFNLDAWVVHFYCDYSAYHISFNLPHKTQEELIYVTQEFLALTNDNWGFTTRYIQSDGEKGLGLEWNELVTARGITFNPSPPDTPDQNGLAERSGGVIMAIARKLRIQGKLPHKLWPYMVSHATRILNRIPVQRKQWQTPFEMVHNRKPNIAHFKIIGSLAYVLIKSKRERPAKAKLSDKAIKGWLVGLNATNIYKIWIPHMDRVVMSRDVQIDEKIMYDAQLTTSTPENGQLSITINEIDLDDSDTELPPIDEDVATTNPELVQYEVPPSMNVPQPPTFTQPTSNVLNHPNIPQNQHSYPTPALNESRQSMANTIQQQFSARKIRRQSRRHAHSLRLERSKLGKQTAHAFVTAQSIGTHRNDLLPPPQFWKQLKRHPEQKEFKHAADAEIQSLEQKETYELVDYPKDKQVLPLKWVFTYKFDDAGYLIRHKARICVRGDLQHQTKDDIYAATGAYRSFRILMALVCAFGLLCHHIDFKNAFTNAKMDEELYTTCPPGYGKHGKVWKLLKALYGLRRSPKLWFDELVSHLNGLGFNHCPDEPCILINKETEVILFLYVDDLLVIVRQECTSQLQQFKTAVNSKYGIKDLGEVTSFLNIRILRDTKAKRLWICQDGYIDKICAKFGIDGSMRTALTPLISSYHAHSFEGKATIQQVTEMQEKVGSILYAAVVSRPDVSFAASQLSQFTLNPSPEHLRSADRVLSYLHSTKYYGIEFQALQAKLQKQKMLMKRYYSCQATHRSRMMKKLESLRKGTS